MTEATHTQFTTETCGAMHRVHSDDGFTDYQCELSGDSAKHPRDGLGCWLHHCVGMTWCDPLPPCGYTIRRIPLSPGLILRRDRDGVEMRFNPEWLDRIFDLSAGGDGDSKSTPGYPMRGSALVVLGADQNGGILFWSLRRMLGLARVIAGNPEPLELSGARAELGDELHQMDAMMATPPDVIYRSREP